MAHSPQPLFEDGVKGLLQRLRAYRQFVATAVTDYPDPARLGRRARAVQYYLSTRWQVFAPFALAYRALLLRRVTFICVTGSTGKTTTKELIAAVLSGRLRGRKSFGQDNRFRQMARLVFRVRPWHDYAVQEISLGQFDVRVILEQPLSLLMPRIGVVTNVGTDHVSFFHGSMDAIAEDKGKLIAALPPAGTAVLNADDPRVLAMAARARARVLTYGTAPDADLRAENISSNWPDRLRFDVVHAGRRYPVRTRLLGAHWVNSVLPAIGVGLTMGVPIPDAVKAIAAVEPVESRMEPIVRPDGVTFIRDDIKVPPAAVQRACEFMSDAQAKRKIIVIGTLSDYLGTPGSAYAAAAKQALEAADLVVCIGRWAHKCLPVQQSHPKGHALYVLPSVETGSDLLSRLFRPGDLVMIKANSNLENTEALLKVPAAPADQPPPPQRQEISRQYGKSWEDLAIRVVVGLGNPRERLERTPHNVGFRVVDMLAETLGGQWTETDDAMIATISNGNRELYLVKPTAGMNRSGEALMRVRERIGFAPEECLLVFDDLALSIGATRFRSKGGYGGHQGCRSVIEAFGTIMVPRIRVGVGRPEAGADVPGYVLRDFAPEDLPKITEACREAVDKIQRVLAR